MKKFRRIEITKEENKKLKVAVYCRVSTKFESQQSSINLQVFNYKTVIQSNSQWEYAGVYFDYGSGLRQKGRSNLEDMIKRLVLVKLIIFSRNLTVDCLGMF